MTEKDTSEPRTSTCPIDPTTATVPANPQEKKKATKSLCHDLDTSKTRKRMLQQPPGLLSTQSHPEIPEFFQDATCLFDLIKECIHYHIKKSVNKEIPQKFDAGNNPEIPGNRRDLHLFAVSLAAWPDHHL